MANSRFHYVIYISTTPARLWQTFIDPDANRQFWFGTWQDCKWKPGAAWRIMTPDGRVADTGEVLEIEPQKRLVLSWRNELIHEMRDEGFSRFTCELQQHEGAVILTITHEMDKPNAKFIEAVSTGWPPILSSLKSLIETGQSLEFTRNWPEGM